ncbi:MAG: restriction endonuclease subunit S, partial [Lachnospiraceae bacterium]|nr:restriction endonuclease subunit S [Lachnospiraceae bacterium]
MKYERKEYTVQELIDKGMLCEPIDGNHGSIHPKTADYVSSGVPFIMANNLVDGVIDFNSCTFISEKQAQTLRKGFAKSGDVLLTHKATIGRTAIVPNNYETIVLTPQVTYYRTISGIHNGYLKYYFDSPSFQTILNNWAGSGSTRAYLGIKAQHKLPIVLPPYEIQVKISRVLETFDQKIKINRGINENLEQQAAALMTNYCATTSSTAELGQIMSFENGFAFQSKSYLPSGKYRIITIKNVQDGKIDSQGAAFINDIPPKMKAGCFLSIGDSLLSLTGNVGRVGIVYENELLLNQRVAEFLPNDTVLLPWLYYYFRLPSMKTSLET